MSVQNERYGYIDCCRGILAVLIIVFHIWGIFNGFVSSFVVASFFILSGYISKADNHSLRNFAKKKICGLLVPYIVVNTGYYFAFWFFKSICMEFICPISIEEGTNLVDYWINVLDFPTNGGWFTASWFIWVLFWVVMLDKVCRFVFRGRSIWVYWCTLMGMNVIVQFTVINERSAWFAYVDLIMIGCLFYNIGNILKRINVLDKVYACVETSKILWVGVCTMVIYYIFPELAVDWPLRQFGNILVNLIYTIILFGIIYMLES